MAKIDMNEEKLKRAFELALYAINRIDDVSSHLERFDEAMEGSAITEELNEEIEKSRKRLIKILDKRFKELWN